MLFLQQAETVRLATTTTAPAGGGGALAARGGNAADAADGGDLPGGSAAAAVDGALPVTQARVGAALLVRTAALGTHVGRAIRATVNER